MVFKEKKTFWVSPNYPDRLPFTTTFISARENDERNAKIRHEQATPVPFYNKDKTKHIMLSFNATCPLGSFGVENLDDLLALPATTILEDHLDPCGFWLGQEAFLEILQALADNGYTDKQAELESIKDEMLALSITDF